MGFNLFADLVKTAKPPSMRIDAARRLAESPAPEQRLEAATALLPAAEYKQAGVILFTVAPALSNLDPTFHAQYAYAVGRVLLVSDPPQGRAALDAVAANNPKTRWGNLASAHVARSLFSADKHEEDLARFDQLVREYPKTGETGDALWWLAERYAEKGKDAEAAAQYLRMATACPGHDRAAEALFEAGNLYRRHGEHKKATEVYTRLSDKYPRSPLASAACYENGVIHEAQGNPRAAKADYARATKQGIGNYYTHRALERLQELKRGAGSEHTTINGLVTFVRPIDLPAKSLPQADASFRSEPWAEPLFFFADHGFDEAEWEAMHLATTAQVPGGAMTACLAMAEAGLVATAQQIVEKDGLGILNGIPAPDWYRVMYPRAYWSQVRAIADDTHVDPYLLLAVGRQESVFQPGVVSKSGAKGVMQVMPETAAWLAKVEPAVAREDATNLHDPRNSLKLGAYYLRRMIESNDGNLVLAVAAYNAGPGNVSKWRKQRPKAGMEEFIDSIPYAETKDYVKKVLGNYAAYHSLYPEPSRVAAALQ
jgi:soluble lytic murein transglycosylase